MFFLAPDEKTLNEINKVVLYHLNNTNPILQKIVPVLKSDIDKNFDKQSSPEGKKWKQSKAAKKAKRLTLVDTREMRDYLLFPIINSSINTFASDIADEYAYKHQFGGVTQMSNGDEIFLPERRFAGLSNEGSLIVENIIIENLFL